MKTKTIIGLAAALLLSGCASPNKTGYTIGICQYVAHPALDAATQGFIDAVNELKGEKEVAFDVQSAAADLSTCTTISNLFVQKKYDLIMANATPALQAAANSTMTIPILGTSVTEYGVALSLSDFSGTVGGNISGTSDLAPLDEQAAMFDELLPSATRIGLLYCAGEPNSLYQVQVVEQELRNKGKTTTRISFSDSNSLQAVLSGAIGGVDAIYIPTDNTCADAASTIDGICSEANIPIIAGEEGICSGCGVATLTIDYYSLGKKTGQMAAEILFEGKDIRTMPIAYDEHPVKKYNPAICARFGLVPPSDYTAI